MAIDRSREFLSTVQSLRSKHPLQSYASVESQKYAIETGYTHTEFHLRLSHLTSDIVKMGETLEKLVTLARVSSLQDDKHFEIQEYTQILKHEITNINDQFKQLQSVQQINYNQSHEEHSKQIVKSLQIKFANMSSSFKEVIKERSQTIHALKQRREQQFGSVDTSIPQNNTLMYPPALPNASTSSPSLLLQKKLEGGGSSTPTRRAHAQYTNAYTNPYQSGDPYVDDVPYSNREQQVQLLQYVPAASSTDTYYQSRNTAMESIETAINELGYIFGHLAQMVSMQHESVQRIDMDLEIARDNIERGQQELLKYWRAISNNRSLLLTSFGVLILFLVIFSFLFA